MRPSKLALPISLLFLACGEAPPEPAPDVVEPREQPSDDKRELYVIDMTKKVDIEALLDAGFVPSGQLPGNHTKYPGGLIVYLRPIDIDILDFDFDIIPIPWWDVPYDFDDVDLDCTHEPPTGRYCAYVDASLSAERCFNSTIETTLMEYDALPPFGGDDFAQLIDIGDSHEGRPTYALRIGKHASGKGGVPQIVVFAAQHAREWITTDAAMSLIDHYAGNYASDPMIRAELEDVVLTVVPVSNPDGYEHTFTDRDWRANRNASCVVDPNRNFPFAATQQPGASHLCGQTHHGKTEEVPASHAFHGPSEKETDAAVALMRNEVGGDFPTALALNVHAYGQLMLYPDGMSPDFFPCGPAGNCSNADLAAHHVLGGTFRQPKLVDEIEGYPYRPGQKYRNIYAVSGDLNGHAQSDLGIMSFGMEIGRGTCGFGAETRHDWLNIGPTDQLIALVKELLDRGPGLHSGSFYDSHPELGAFALPHLHRRHAVTYSPAPPAGFVGVWPPPTPPEQPTIRVASRTYVTSVSVFPENGDPALPAEDDVLEGVAYRSWRWRPTSDPFTFPGKLWLCGNQAQCEPMRIGDGSKSVDICRSDFFGTDGWEHIGRGTDPSVAQDQCFWQTTGSGSGTGVPGETNVWTLANGVGLHGFRQAQLVFSYQRTGGAMDLTIKASTSGVFDPCDVTTGCRVAWASRLPHGFNASEAGGLRTEIVDLADFDGTDVWFRWELRDASPTAGKIKIYDPVFIGWAG